MTVPFTAEQKMMQKLARDFAENEIAPLDAAMDKSGRFPHELIEKMQAQGFFGIIFPEEYQGGGADTLAGTLTIYEIAKASASVALTLDGHWLATDTILYHGTEEQKKKYLTRAATDTITAFCLTEPCAGSDAAGIMSSAVWDGGEWVLNGTKAWVTNGGVAGVYVILAKTDQTKGARGISAFIVEADTPGLTVGRKEDKMGVRGSQTTELALNDVRLKKEALLGAEGGGFKIAMMALDSGRISIGAMAAGLIEAALATARGYARERHAFGGPIANLQAIQFMIADMAIALKATQLMTFEAAALKAARQRHTQEAAMAKVFGSRHAVKSCLDAIQILGGNGYSRDNRVERLLRDAKMLEIGEGTTEVLKMLVGRNVLA